MGEQKVVTSIVSRLVNKVSLPARACASRTLLAAPRPTRFPAPADAL
jgi:hypothetical protein